MKTENVAYDQEAYYRKRLNLEEFPELPESQVEIENIGWTLGNDCPYRCAHCYSMNARQRGKDLEKWMVDLIIEKLVLLGVRTVNLGGNEPVFTHGLDLKKTLLPYIITSLVDKGILVGLTTSGISLIHLEQHYPDEVRKLNDIDISFDSPFEEEHNRNRGADLFKTAIKSLEICQENKIDHTIILTAMAWNFTRAHITGIMDLAKAYEANIRINTLKPVQPQHMNLVPSVSMFFDGFAYLMENCDPIDLGEPLLAAASSHPNEGCPCGRKSFRIHSITPEGKIPVSPCVYLHDYKAGDLLKDNIFDIIQSPQFRVFRRRAANPQVIEGCSDCSYLDQCRGGCASRSFLYNLHNTGNYSLFVRDPGCLKDYQNQIGLDFPVFPQKPSLPNNRVLVHRNYLCTWIGKPKV